MGYLLFCLQTEDISRLGRNLNELYDQKYGKYVIVAIIFLLGAYLIKKGIDILG